MENIEKSPANVFFKAFRLIENLAIFPQRENTTIPGYRWPFHLRYLGRGGTCLSC